MTNEEIEWGMVRRKRAWCPEWLWFVACNPIPFWNETLALAYPQLRVYLAPLTWLLSEPVKP